MEQVIDKKSVQKVELDDNIRANLITTSLNIIEAINSGESDIHRESKQQAEIFYTERVLKLLPNNVDALCLIPGKTILRDSLNEEKPLIWGKTEVNQYLKKLNKSRKWELNK